MILKTCKRCLETKELSYFFKHKGMKDGHLNFCKECKNKDSKDWVKRNPQKRKDIANKYASANRNPEYKKAWWKSNPHKHGEYYKAREVSIPGYANSICANRRAKKKMAKPKWANSFCMQVIYAKSRRMSIWLGQIYHVDHIVPLVSEFVCGLHSEHNLQIILGAENQSKNNRHWPDMW